MEADPVSHLYERYKLGTSYIKDWLVDTVRQQQDITKVLAISRPVQPRTSGKKARNKQKKADAAEQKILLSCDDLLRLASTLSSTSHKEPSGLQDVITVARDVIRGRRECSQWYAEHDRDAGHEGFIRTLEQILRALLPLCSTKKRSTPAQKAAKGPNQASTEGAFSALTIEEPSDEPLGRIPQIKPTTTHKDKLPTDTSFELKRQNGEAQLALYCFLRECSQIRSHVRTTWHDYKVGNASLFVASQVAFAAYGVIKKLADDFIVDVPDLDTFNKIADFLGIAHETSLGELKRFHCDKPSADQDAGDDDTLLDLTCTNAFVGLLINKKFMHDIRSDDPSRAMDPYIHCNTFHPLLRTFMELRENLKGLMFVGEKGTEEIGGVDPFTADFLLSHNGPGFHPAVVVMFQMHMDIFDTLGEHRRWTAMVVSIHNDYIGNAIIAFKDFVNSRVADERSTREARREAQAIILRWIGKGATMKKQYRPGFPVPSQPTEFDTNPFVGHLPLLGGHLTSKILLLWHLDSATCGNMSLLVVTMAHLYRACKTAGYLKEPWTDMEHLIKWHGAQRLGLRDHTNSSTPLLAAAKDFRLAHGVELKAYSKERKAKSGAFNARVRLPEFPQKHTYDAALLQQNTWTAETMRCSDRKKGIYVGQPERGSTIHRGMHRMMKAHQDRSSRALDESTTQQWKQNGQLPPTKLLEIMRQALEEEEVALNFPYTDLMIVCYCLLDEMNTELHPRIAAWRDPHLLETYQHREMVDEVLWAAAEEQHTGTTTDEKTGLLKRCAEILQGAISRDGSYWYDSALAWSGGHLREEMIPAAHTLRDSPIYEGDVHTVLQGGRLELKVEGDARG